MQLAAPAFLELPLGSISTHGWLKDWVQTQIDGLFGHLQDFWPDIENSTWIGGAGDTGLHERLPYWLNGMIPAAFLAQDERLIAVVDSYVDIILQRQLPSGWFGPDDSGLGGNQYWARFPLMLSLLQYAQFRPSQADRILNATRACMREMQLRMLATPMGDSWSGARFMDGMLSAHWLLDHAPAGQESQLWDTADLLAAQGFTWGPYFAEQLPHGPVPAADANLYNHGVNVAQALKSQAVVYRQSRDPVDADSARFGVEQVFKYHGLPHGVFGADEHLAGSMPSRGTELCTVVETAFSMSKLFQILGDVPYADRAERIVLNALNGEITPSMWAHQYLQQTNQRAAGIEQEHVWATDGPDAIIFGLAPNYGCCTANGPQGLPKFVTQSIFATEEGGVAVVQLTPAAVSVSAAFLTRVRDGDVSVMPRAEDAVGTNVTVNVTSQFPFEDTVTIVVDGATDPNFALHVRIPTWAANATLSVDGATAQPVAAGHMVPVKFAATSGSVVINLSPQPRLEMGYNNSVSVYRGALMYALPIKESVQVLNRYYLNSTDMAFANASAWQFALVADPAGEPTGFVFNNTGSVPGLSPWAPETMPLSLSATVRSLPTWGLELNSTAPPPSSPIDCTSSLCGDGVVVPLVPYGATNLRIAAFPWAKP